MIWRAEFDTAKLQQLVADAKRDGRSVVFVANVGEEQAQLTVHAGAGMLVSKNEERLS